tara:strand:- start:410 stop:1813 length:1404 start_codon:yes stop_codon:yes gene_type:complete
MNEPVDVSDWGSIVGSGTPDQLLMNELKNGVYEVLFESRVLYMKISNISELHSRKTILICLNAAISGRNNKKPPYFSGEGVANSIQSCLISISDPSTHIKGVDLGWYIGNEGWLSFQADLCGFLDQLSNFFSKKLVFFGGSGGGYASITISLGLSVPSLIIAMNPQLDITLYPTARIFATRAFPSYGISNEENFADVRDEWVTFFESKGLITKVSKEMLNPLCDYLVLQNWNDTHHLRLHMPFLCPNVAEFSLSEWYGHADNFGYVIAPWGDRHSVVWRDHIQLCLSMGLEGRTSFEIIQSLTKEFLPQSANNQQIASQLFFPPLHAIGPKKAPLNLVRFDANFFEKHHLETEMLDLSFLHRYLAPRQTNLDIYAVLSSLECWATMKRSNSILEEKSWNQENLDSLVRIILALGEEFGQRPAMNHHRSFLLEFISDFLENIKRRRFSINSTSWDEINKFHSNLSSSE